LRGIGRPAGVWVMPLLNWSFSGPSGGLVEQTPLIARILVSSVVKKKKLFFFRRSHPCPRPSPRWFFFPMAGGRAVRGVCDRLDFLWRHISPCHPVVRGAGSRLCPSILLRLLFQEGFARFCLLEPPFFPCFSSLFKGVLGMVGAWAV